MTEANGECQHDWVYQSVALLTMPSKYRRICRKCGKKETVTRGQFIDRHQYEKVVKQFGEKP